MKFINFYGYSEDQPRERFDGRRSPLFTNPKGGYENYNFTTTQYLLYLQMYVCMKVVESWTVKFQHDECYQDKLDPMFALTQVTRA